MLYCASLFLMVLIFRLQLSIYCPSHEHWFWWNTGLSLHSGTSDIPAEAAVNTSGQTRFTNLRRQMAHCYIVTAWRVSVHCLLMTLASSYCDWKQRRKAVVDGHKENWFLDHLSLNTSLDMGTMAMLML